MGGTKRAPAATSTDMTFEDERTKGSNNADERVEHIAEWLEVTLGPRLTAYAERQ